MKVAITLPALRSLELDRKARATIRGFESKQAFEATVHHGSVLDGTIAAGALRLEATFGSEVALKGTAEDARLEADYGCRLPLDRLAVRTADVRLDYGSTATIDAKTRLDYRLDHGSKLEYLGNPTIGRSWLARESSATPQ